MKPISEWTEAERDEWKGRHRVKAEQEERFVTRMHKAEYLREQAEDDLAAQEPVIAAAIAWGSEVDVNDGLYFDTYRPLDDLKVAVDAYRQVQRETPNE